MAEGAFRLTRYWWLLITLSADFVGRILSARLPCSGMRISANSSNAVKQITTHEVYCEDSGYSLSFDTGELVWYGKTRL